MGYQMVRAVYNSAQITKLYTWISHVYDPFTSYEWSHHMEALNQADIAPGLTVLEVACGTGRVTVEIAYRLRGDGEFHAIDLTEAMLKKARKKLEKRQLAQHVSLCQGNACQLPFPDEKFDLLYNGYMFDLIDTPEIPPIVSEFKRVLKPGGRLVLVNMSKNTSKKTLYERLYDKGLLSLFGGCRPVIMEPLLLDAGFTDVRREYRNNHSLSFFNHLFGAEIVTANNPG